MAGPRREARTVAFQTLFEVDTTGHAWDGVLARRLAEGQLPPEGAAFARRLAEGVMQRRPEIDRLISEAASAWPLAQMAPVDKNLLRLAVFELMFDSGGAPHKAIINEAVELAKLFGSESSSKFVNGVLGTIVVRRDKASP